jgi:DNA-nicking Smr family endonuclease
MPQSPSDSDDQFHEILGDITPIEQDQHFLKPPHNKPLLQHHTELEPSSFHMEAGPRINEPFSPLYGPESVVDYLKPGVDDRALKKLRQGKMMVNASLDLHGLNKNQADESLLNFFSTAIEQQWRCVKVIHGKGGEDARMKNFCYHFCVQHSQVLALASCTAKDGGTGAMYILLKIR